jgi:hypothetical protein
MKYVLKRRCVVIFVVKRDIREVECPQETLAIEVVVVSTILGTKL